MDFYVRLLPDIVKNLTQVNDVLDRLLAGEYITSSNYEAINSELTESGKIRKMLEILRKRKCPHKIFMEILSNTGNENLAECFQKEMEKTVAPKKPVGKKTDERNILIFEGADQDEILHDHFSINFPGWHVSHILGSLETLKSKMITVPQNQFRYFDIIVLCDDKLNPVTNDSLKTMIPYIEELLPKFPPSIVTFLIVVDDNGDSGYVFNSDSRSVDFNDTRDSQPVIRVLKKKFFHKFLEGFFKSKEMLNIYVWKDFQMEEIFVTKKPVEEKTDKRKIFILESINQDETLHDHFSINCPDWDVSHILGSLETLKANMITVPKNQFRYFDVIVLCDDKFNPVTNDSLKTMKPYIEEQLLPKFKPSIVTFLIVVDDNGDTGHQDTSDSHLVNINDTQDSQSVITVLKKKFFYKFLKEFFNCEEMFNIYVRKADIRKQLSLQVLTEI